ncbi:MAG: hypothetical protein JSV99_07965 [Planctomycetota bacterium]|nr:MAG: hypothetical protein JSV99_07965 [Planctomycetota bacterium]
MVMAIFAFSAVADLVSAVTPPVSATCDISCTVAEIVEWSQTSFPAIELAELTTQKRQATASASLVLYTNGDVKITADNSDEAELSKGGNHKLVTEYRLECDPAGAVTGWSSYDCFLSNGLTVKRTGGDGAVEVTLGVRASKDGRQAAGSGRYGAMQTLTVCWGS